MSGLSFFLFGWVVMMVVAFRSFHSLNSYEPRGVAVLTRAHSHAQWRTVFVPSAPGLLFFAIFLSFFLLYIVDFKVCMIQILYILYILCMRNRRF